MSYVNNLCNTPFKQSLRPLCLPRATIELTRSPLDAQRRQHVCLGRLEVVHRTFNNRHGRHDRHQVLSVFKTVAEGSPRRLVAQCRSNEAEGTQRHRRGCRMDSQWSANDRHIVCAFYCKAQSLNVGDVSASPVPLLCLHSATMATLEHPCRWFCLLSASFIVRRAGLLWSQQDFEWLWSVPLSSASLY